MLSCLEDRGATGVVAVGGPVVIGYPVDEHGNPPPGIEEISNAAEIECLTLVDQPEAWVLPQGELLYSRVLDVTECLAYHGTQVAPPPSLETWLDQNVPWDPYADLLERPPSTRRELMDDCPQVGNIGAIVDIQSLADAGL
jgi:hypothetical protein